jgi:localization factor PodJL
MSKALSRNPSGLDDATRAAVRRAAQREGKSLQDWIDEAIRLRAHSETQAGMSAGEKTVPPEHGLRVPEIIGRLQQRHVAATQDGLAQSLAAAGQRLAEASARSHARRDLDQIAVLRRELNEMEQVAGAESARQSPASHNEIAELLGLLDDHIDAQRHAGVSQALLAPAIEIASQLRFAVDKLHPASALRDIRAGLDAVARSLDDLCGQDSSSATAIGDLSRQISAVRQQLSRILKNSPHAARFEAGLVELARHVCMLAESGALAQSRYARELESLSQSIGALVAAETDRSLAVIRGEMSSLVADFGGALDRAGQKNLVEMDARLRDLGDSLSRSLSHQLEQSFSRHAADATRLQSLTETLAQKIDAALTGKAAGSDIDSLGKRMNRVEEQVREPQVVDLLGRLDAMQASLTQSVESGASHRRTELAEHIEKLAARLDQALNDRVSDDSLSGLETQIERLAARLDAVHDETLKMAETIARQAGEASAQAMLEKGGAAFKASEQKETLETLRAVHEWLARTGERFATVEGVVRQLQETQNRSLKLNGNAPDVADYPVQPGETTAPTPVVEALAIPMGGDAVALDARVTQAGFIAAARRAARQAARGRWAQDAEESERRQKSLVEGRFLDGLAAHRRSALVVLGAVMLLAGAYQLTQNISFDDARQITEARDATLPSPKGSVETAARAPLSSSKQASAVDPAPVGAIVNPGRAGVVASMNSAMALATLAANGDAAAQFELASRYADGRDIARDAKLAVLWFDKAAQQGLAPAQYRLGTLYEKGLGVERNEIVARDWYQRAAAAGNVRAMHNLAVMLAEGGDGKPDYAAAAVWFRKAAELGLRDSQFNLAILYARGLGVETSLVQSYLWFSAAAAQGDADAGKKRDEVAARLGAKDLETAKALAAGFRAETPVPAANDVATPPGGWRAPAAPAPRAPGKPKMSWFQSF